MSSQIKQGTPMKNFGAYFGFKTSLLALLLGVLAAGCGRDAILGIEAITKPDATRPTVTATVPADGATGVATNTKITATFSEDMAPATISGTSFKLAGPGTTAVTGTVTYSVTARTATFTPTSPATLAANALFTGTITTGATDLAGNPLLANFVWTFATGATADNTPPTVTAVNPTDLSTGVCLQKSVNATFSEAMDPTTITQVSPATFTVRVTGPPLGPALGGTVTYDVPSRVATFSPASDLAASTQFTATVKGGASGVKDLAGNPLASDKVWTFTTGTAACSPLLPPAILGTAAPFGTLGGATGMTNQGIQTVVNGDIGTTAASTTVTGFHDIGPGCTYTEVLGSNIGAVNGKIYTAAPPPTVGCPTEGTAQTAAIAQQALDDARAAYNTLAGLAGNLAAGNLGGLTLAPGVYTAPAGSFLIQGADLTLDAQGDANAVFVFQMASTLTVGGPGAAFPQSVILINGALAKNVFWQVGSAATINAAGGGTMQGTIIAQSGAAFSTAGNTTIVTLNGRVLSLGASVTLVDTVINVPAP
jgi:hypothetical protein